MVFYFDMSEGDGQKGDLVFGDVRAWRALHRAVAERCKSSGVGSTPGDLGVILLVRQVPPALKAGANWLPVRKVTAGARTDILCFGAICMARIPWHSKKV